MPDTLYARLGGYDGIAAVCDNLLPRLSGCPQLGRFWAHRAADGLRREKQLLVDFLCLDWQVFIGPLGATLDAFKVPAQERGEVLGFVESLRADVLD